MREWSRGGLLREGEEEEVDEAEDWVGPLVRADEGRERAGGEEEDEQEEQGGDEEAAEEVGVCDRAVGWRFWWVFALLGRGSGACDAGATERDEIEEEEEEGTGGDDDELMLPRMVLC